MSNRGGTVVNGTFGSCLGDEDGMICKTDDLTFSERAQSGVLDLLARILVDDSEDLFEGLAQGLVLLPAGQGLGHAVQEGHAARAVRGDDGIPDTRERSAKPLPLLLEE